MMVHVTRKKSVVFYTDAHGRKPFAEWMDGLKDRVTRKRIIARLARLEDGNYGDCKPVGEGVYELRMFFGSGYRVYFGESGTEMIVLLCCGDKASQSKDVERAIDYWKEYRSHA